MLSSKGGSGKFKKVLVRDVDQRINKTTATSCAENSESIFLTENLKAGTSKSSENYKTKPSSKDYADPGLHSSKIILKQIKRVEEMVHKKCDNLNDVDSVSRIIAEKKISKKLNFHFNNKIYKDLVALNISDSDVASRVRKKASVPSYISKMPKDIEPCLNDFYEDKIELDKPILPAPLKIKYTPLVKYSGRDIYEKIISWESP